MSDICLVNGVYPPEAFGGAENYTERVAGALRERGHDAYVLTTTSKVNRNTLSIQKEIKDGIPVYRFYPLNIYHRSEGTGGNILSKALWHQLDTVNPHASRVVSKFLESIDPDIVHTNNFMGITASAGKAITKFDCKYIHTLHDYSLICPKSNLLRDMTLPGDELGVCNSPPAPCQAYAKAKKHAIGHPDLVLGPSQHVIDIHQKHGFFEKTQTKRIQHGIKEYAENPPESRSKSILYVGKHLRAKGLETLFEAARELPQITVHLCGTGPFDSTSEEVASELDNVKYHGYVSDRRLYELRREVSAAVVPSIWMENSPLTIYESFAEGLPVIGSNIGGIPELVDDSRGKLFPPGDADTLVEKILEMTQDSNAKSYGENCLKWARDHTMRDHIDRLLLSYNV